MNSERFGNELQEMIEGDNPPQTPEETVQRMKDKGWTETQIQDWISHERPGIDDALYDFIKKYNWFGNQSQEQAEIDRYRKPHRMISGEGRLDAATPDAAMPVPPRPNRRPTREETQRQLGRNWNAYS